MLCLDDCLREGTANCMVEEKASVPKSFERRLANELLVIETMKKASAHDHTITVVTLRNCVEVLRVCITWILSNDEATEASWKPLALNFVSVPRV